MSPAWIRSIRFTVLVVVGALLVQCSSPDASWDPSPPGTPIEAGTVATQGTSASVARVAALASPAPALAARVSPKGAQAGFVEQDGALVSPGWRRASRGPSRAVGARFSQRADQGFRVSLGASDDVGLTLTPRGARSSSAVLDGGRLAFPDAYPSTDLVAVADDDVVEWMYLLRDEQAPTTFSLDVALGSQLVDLRLDNSGALLAVDAKGEALFRIARPFALDATGARRDAGMEYRDGRLTLQLDTTGLTYPVLLDPAVETAAWELRSGPPASRYSYAMAYDQARERVVLFGGVVGSTRAGDTWEYDGEVWRLRSTVGPSPRSEASAAYDGVNAKVMLFGGTGGSGSLNDTWLWDGSLWTQACTGSCTRPGARDGADMVFDSKSKRVALFGGWNAKTAQNYGDTWEWDGSAWAQVASTGPSPRHQHALAYDEARAQTVLFGGTTDGTDLLGDTWVWDGTKWTLGATSGPSARRATAMAFYDTKVVLYGGYTSTKATNDTWEWSGTSWAQRTPATDPGARSSHRLVNATGDHRLVTFGGPQKGDTWEWDGTDWAEPTTLPAPRDGAQVTFDSGRAKTVLFGGSQRRDTWEWDGFGWTKKCVTPACSASVPPNDYLSGFAFDPIRERSVLFGGSAQETWEWNGAVWEKRCTTAPCSATRPPARHDGAMAYDSARQVSLLFGGSSLGSGRNDLWAWNGAAWTELCTSAACKAAAPAPRIGTPMVAFDSRRAVLVVFAGSVSSLTSNELWEWSGTSWTQKCTAAPCSATKPSARWIHAMAFDDVRGRVIIQGGQGSSPGLRDTWEWDGTSFVQTDAGSASSPAGRHAHSLAYDRGRRRTVMFGGTDDAMALCGDTWEYHVRGNGCAVGNSCATGFCVDGVCCESAQCGACQACDTAANPGVCSPVTGADDLDTCSGTNTCSALGECKKKTGQLCGSAAQCASGFCADGFCCNSACDGGCDQCASTPGTCNLRAAGHAGSAPVCGGFACTGASGACPTTCAVDTDCVSAYYCAADGTCQPRRASGAACNTAAGVDCKVAGCRECSAGGCVDFVCCATASCATCQTCNGATPGTCSSVTNADDADSCTGGNTCSASGACKKKLGQACGAGADCASGFCADGVCCNGACTGGCDVCKASLGAPADGQCTLLAAGAAGIGCGNYACTGASGACPSSCSTDAACVASAYCDTATGTCKADQNAGGACATGAQCASGNCVDGFCCNSACTGLCQACSAGKTGLANGTCGSVTGGTDPDNECATDGASTCQKDGFCNGAGACRLYTSGTACASPTCTAGVANASACDGSGTCKTTPTACSPYACSGTACGTSCANDGQCQSGYYCATGGTCQAKKGLGVACAATNQCSSGNCADGVCCDTACNQSCQACSAAKKGGGADGTCGPVKVDTDPDNECATGAACGQTGNCNGAGACKIASLGTACGATSCTNGVQTGQQCDGAGTCASGSSTTCPTGYTCLNASVCATSCTDDTQCAGGYYCANGSCAPAQAVGATCGNARQCAGGNCVDGVCCDGVCTGVCQACSNAKTGAQDGQCKPVKVDTDPDNECTATTQASCQENGSCDGSGACKKWPFGTVCGSTSCANAVQTGQVCDGSGTCVGGQSAPCATGYECATATACATGCTTDAQCVATYFCQVGSGTCQPDQGNGDACASASQCQSGNCVDGVCCDAPCAGSCQACSAAKKGDGDDGTCGFVKVDTDPDDECEAELQATCQKTGSCDGSGKCKLYASGTNCGANSCTGPTTLTGQQCDGLGSCIAGQTTSCDPYVCSGTACLTGCNDDASCAPGAFCSNDSTCHVKNVLATACTSDHECKSGFCVEGVCCNTACNGICQACTQATKEDGSADGTCAFAKAALDPHSDCPDDRVEKNDPTSCARDGLCDGAGACRNYAQGTACGSTSCAGNVQTGHACDGAGVCLDNATQDCGEYACVAGACATSCTKAADCNTAAYCDTATSVCKPKSSLGAACTAADTCQSGLCVDGFCCNKACDGQCEACDVGTAKGTCSPVNGAPHGARPACAEGTAASGDGACAARTCDGEDGSTCQGYVGSAVGCRDQSCAGGVQSFSATCNGHGVCGEASDALQTRPCEPYACGATACKDKCATDGDCAKGYKCDAASGKCLNGASCDGDHTITAPGQAPTDCRPYRCRAGGTCMTTCASVDDCVEGFVCDTDGRCATATVVQADDASAGGCGCRTAGGDGGGAGWLGAGLLAASAFVRRRRRGEQRADS